MSHRVIIMQRRGKYSLGSTAVKWLEVYSNGLSTTLYRSIASKSLSSVCYDLINLNPSAIKNVWYSFSTLFYFGVYIYNYPCYAEHIAACIFNETLQMKVDVVWIHVALALNSKLELAQRIFKIGVAISIREQNTIEAAFFDV